MSPEFSRSFDDIGLPTGHACPHVAYHPPTGTVIVHTRPSKSRLPSHRLSIRRVHDTRYTLVADFPPQVSISSFAVSPSLPVLYFLTDTWRESGDTVGGDWHALHRYALDTADCEIVAQPGELKVPAPYNTAWLVEVLSVGHDAATLFCRVGMKVERARIDYYLAEFSVSERWLRPITRLERTFA